MDVALRRLASVFFLPSVTSFSASRCASLALCQGGEMDSCSKSDVTRFRSMACRWAELRLKCRYFIWPPAMVAPAATDRRCYRVSRMMRHRGNDLETDEWMRDESMGRNESKM